MSQPFVGEIRMFAGNFAPAGWMFCAGQLLPISEFETLFNLIGTTYGGDGQSTFALPDLQGRVPMHMGNGVTLAETGGAESITLNVNQIPSHNHNLLATDGGSVLSPLNAILAVPTSTVQGLMTYTATGGATTPLVPASIGSSGGSQPHENRQPFLCVSFIMSMFGVFPSQS
jgi:microcystin-dependent protein